MVFIYVHPVGMRRGNKKKMGGTIKPKNIYGTLNREGWMREAIVVKYTLKKSHNQNIDLEKIKNSQRKFYLSYFSSKQYP